MDAIATTESSHVLHDPGPSAIVELHRGGPAAIDWDAVAAAPPPCLPTIDRRRSDIARARLASYRPDPLGLLDRSRLLARFVDEALVGEERAHRSALAGWRAAIAGWAASRGHAARMLTGDAPAYHDAVERTACLAPIEAVLGSAAVRLRIERPTRAQLELHVIAEALATSVRAAITSADGPSSCPVRCALALRAMRSLLAVLPIDEVGVRVLGPEGDRLALRATRRGFAAVDPARWSAPAMAQRFITA